KTVHPYRELTGDVLRVLKEWKPIVRKNILNDSSWMSTVALDDVLRIWSVHVHDDQHSHLARQHTVESLKLFQHCVGSEVEDDPLHCVIVIHFFQHLRKVVPASI